MAAAEEGTEASHVHAAHVLLAGTPPSPSSRSSQPTAPQVLQRRVAQFPPHILARWMKVDCKGRVNVGLQAVAVISPLFFVSELKCNQTSRLCRSSTWRRQLKQICSFCTLRASSPARAILCYRTPVYIAEFGFEVSLLAQMRTEPHVRH